MLDVDGFLTCFGPAASAFENIELGYIHCALKGNFSVTLKGFTCVSLICRELCLPFIEKFVKFWLGILIIIIIYIALLSYSFIALYNDQVNVEPKS